MNAVEHIITLSTTPWVMWLMLFLLVLFVIADIHQPKMWLTAWQMAFKRTDRVYNDAAIVGVGSLEQRLFCLLTGAFSWTVFFYKGGEFALTYYLLITGCVLGWSLCRWGLRELIARIGKLKRYGFPNGYTMSLCLVLVSFLYLLNLGSIWIDRYTMVWRIGMAVVLAVWLITIFIRHYQCFVHNWKTFLGLIAYWLTVEVGSLIGLYLLISVL